MSGRIVNPLHPDVIEYAYRHGYFPMPHPDTGEVLWFDPDPRTIIPLDKFHVSHSLKKSLRTRGYSATIDKDFMGVVHASANRPETWINQDFIKMYKVMHDLGLAHSVEVWSSDELVGGVFGLTFNGVFNAESMFSTKTDASKIALYYLVQRMKQIGLTLLEVQFMSGHLASLGAIGVPAAQYHEMLNDALKLDVRFGVFST